MGFFLWVSFFFLHLLLLLLFILFFFFFLSIINWILSLLKLDKWQMTYVLVYTMNCLMPSSHRGRRRDLSVSAVWTSHNSLCIWLQIQVYCSFWVVLYVVHSLLTCSFVSSWLFVWSSKASISIRSLFILWTWANLTIVSISFSIVFLCIFYRCLLPL